MQTWTFPSSSSDTLYTTTRADDGKLVCTCRGWLNKRAGQPRHCTHTKRVASTVVTRGDFVYAVDATAPVAPVVVAPAPDAPVPAPMLASAMTTPLSGAAFDACFGTDAWRMEEKMDGHRCTVVVQHGTVRAFARPRAGRIAGLERTLPGPVVEQLRRFPDGRYDGELMAPSGKSWDVTVVGARLVLVLFDVVDAVSLRKTYRLRRARLLHILGTCLTPDQTAVTTVESVVPSWAGVEAIWARGGEGVIVKRVESAYRPGHRSPDWLKVKALHAATLTIVGFDAGKSGPHSALKVRDAAGTETTIKTATNALIRDIAAAPERFLGCRVVISYQEKTPSGTYRHPMFDHFASTGE